VTALADTARSFRGEERIVLVNGVERRLRLVEFARGWLASVDTESGPTLGADRSPYLAAWRALDPLGVELAEAMLVIAPDLSRNAALDAVPGQNEASSAVREDGTPEVGRGGTFERDLAGRRQ
jgi:hypothetical protein